MKYRLTALATALTLLTLACSKPAEPTPEELNAASVSYARHVLDTALKTWNVAAIRSEASTELLQSMEDDKLTAFVAAAEAQLGAIQSYSDPVGQMQTVSDGETSTHTAEYAMPVSFERAQGDIKLGLILQNNQWKLQSFYVKSPAFMP